MVEANTIFGIIICIGIFCTYVPQFHKIMWYKTSHGISHYFLLIGLSGACASLFNALIFYVDTMFTCEDFLDCSEKLLSFYQIAIQFTCFVIFYLLCLIYLPKQFSHEIMIYRPTPFYRKKEFILFGCGFLIVGIISTLSTVFIFKTECSESKGDACVVWAKILGYFSLGTVFIQYLPQIYKVYSEKSVGSISLLMLCLQVVGNAVWVTYLWLDTDADVTTWLPYFGTTIFQFVLVTLCLVLEFRRRRAQKIYSTLIADDTESDVEQPLNINDPEYYGTNND
jgi:uncharacterized protein with PQ loop repeat